MNKLSNISNTLLLGPGPSTVSPNVYTALSTNTIGHLDPRFIDIMDQIRLGGISKVSLSAKEK